jgi:hypothetical protein
MKEALIISGLGVVLVAITPALRALRLRSGSKMNDKEYFAAARKRAIGYRLAKSTSNEGQRDVSSHEQKAR